MSGERANEVIARVLTENGLPARSEDGWVQVTLSNGIEMTISAEYGQSLDVDFYHPPTSTTSAERSPKDPSSLPPTATEDT